MVFLKLQHWLRKRNNEHTDRSEVHAGVQCTLSLPGICSKQKKSKAVIYYWKEPELYNGKVNTLVEAHPHAGSTRESMKLMAPTQIPEENKNRKKHTGIEKSSKRKFQDLETAVGSLLALMCFPCWLTQYCVLEDPDEDEEMRPIHYLWPCVLG